MIDYYFITEQEVSDELDEPYLITINLDNGKRFTLGRDTKEKAIDTVEFISEAMKGGGNFLSLGYVIIRLDSVSAIALTHQN